MIPARHHETSKKRKMNKKRERKEKKRKVRGLSRMRVSSEKYNVYEWRLGSPQLIRICKTGIISVQAYIYQIRLLEDGVGGVQALTYARRERVCVYVCVWIASKIRLLAQP